MGLLNESKHAYPKSSEILYIFRKIFFPHLPVFEIRANYLIHWIYSILVFSLLLPASSPCAAAPEPVVRLPCRGPAPLSCRAPARYAYRAAAAAAACCAAGAAAAACCRCVLCKLQSHEIGRASCRERV